MQHFLQRKEGTVKVRTHGTGRRKNDAAPSHKPRQYDEEDEEEEEEEGRKI